MSKNKGQKIPLLGKRLSIGNNLRNNFNLKSNEYTKIGSRTPRFINLYSKYIKSKQTTIYPNIHSILNEYRAEKLNKLSEQEAMREEIGEEIKKYKDIHDILKRRGPGVDKEKYYDNVKKQGKLKLKENKEIILDTFYRYANIIKPRKRKSMNDKSIYNLVSPNRTFKINKNSLEERIKNKNNNKTSIYFNPKKMIEILDLKVKENHKTKDEKKKRIKCCWDYCHNKLNSYCDCINDESMKVKIKARKTMERFNSSWNKYKILQEFKYPETKKQIF